MGRQDEGRAGMAKGEAWGYLGCEPYHMYKLYLPRFMSWRLRFCLWMFRYQVHEYAVG
jgi:hypothetical protein